MPPCPFQDVRWPQVAPQSGDCNLNPVPAVRAFSLFAHFGASLPLAGLHLGYDTPVGRSNLSAMDQRHRDYRLPVWDSQLVHSRPFKLLFSFFV